ncbi:hypothetical protein FXO37_17654 [Capsicum annuum]|nr:hypothetical protein FXO37_17654 [Capsicum annuum]
MSNSDWTGFNGAMDLLKGLRSLALQQTMMDLIEISLVQIYLDGLLEETIIQQKVLGRKPLREERDIAILRDTVRELQRKVNDLQSELVVVRAMMFREMQRLMRALLLREQIINARKLTGTNIKWHPLSHQYYKLNTDSACLNNPEKERIGGIIRNCRGRWKVGFAKHYPKAANNQMELISLLEGPRLEENHHLVPLEINIDSKEIIYMLKSGNLLYDDLLDEYRLRLRR